MEIKAKGWQAVVHCKICGGVTKDVFGLPRSKRTGHDIPDRPDDARFYECTSCRSLFTTALDDDDHTQIYDDNYWREDDPDWYGKVDQTLRLVMMATELLAKRPDEMEVLDFGCGMGGFVERSREHLQMKTWGTDIIEPKKAREFFLKDLGSRRFDAIVACEVIEHLPDLMGTLKILRAHLKSPGVIGFQTAYWDPSLNRTWWYLGPANGHVTHCSAAGFDHIFKTLGGKERRLWGGYPGLQAWLFQ
ncbi:MAG TPA: class I SAM-dependent methyltransferase [Xanthobacteraceae bacterium]|nr:class I SAM-dependent methyltransferase [Xanthobacteraceae bacterium]